MDTPPQDETDETDDGATALPRRTVVLAIVAGAVALVAIVVGLTVWGLSGSDDPAAPEPGSPEAEYARLGAWAVGDEVHVGEHVVYVPGASALAYTSVGAVVTGSDGYALATPTGELRQLDLAFDEAANALPLVATGVDEPYLAYIRALDDGTEQLVVRDLRNDEEHPVGEPADRGDLAIVAHSWLWDDRLFYLDKRSSDELGAGTTIDWRTGERLPNADLRFANGVGLSVDDEGSWVLRSFDGDTLLTISAPDPILSWARLSPDGQHVIITDSRSETQVHSVETGASAVLDGYPFVVAAEFGWTPDGHLLGQSDDPATNTVLEVCDPATGRCDGDTEIGVVTTVVPGVSAQWP